MGKNAAYAAQYAEEAKEQMRRYGIPASVILAQAILESSNGQSQLSRECNNHVPRRDRKLLLNRKELNKIQRALQDRGLTVVGLRLFLNERLVEEMVTSSSISSSCSKKISTGAEEDKGNVYDLVSDS